MAARRVGTRLPVGHLSGQPRLGQGGTLAVHSSIPSSSSVLHARLGTLPHARGRSITRRDLAAATLFLFLVFAAGVNYTRHARVQRGAIAAAAVPYDDIPVTLTEHSTGTPTSSSSSSSKSDTNVEEGSGGGGGGGGGGGAGVAVDDLGVKEEVEEDEDGADATRDGVAEVGIVFTGEGEGDGDGEDVKKKKREEHYPPRPAAAAAGTAAGAAAADDEEVSEADLESSDPSVFARAVAKMQQRINAREKTTTGVIYNFTAEGGEEAAAGGDGGAGDGGVAGAGVDEGGGLVHKHKRKHRHSAGEGPGSLGAVGTAASGVAEDVRVHAHPLSSGEVTKLDIDPQDLPSDVDVVPAEGDAASAAAAKEDKLAEFPPLPGCNRIFSRNFVTELGGVVPTEELPTKNVSHVFKFTNGYHYAHMAVVAAISPPRSGGGGESRSAGSNMGRSDPVLMAAWQAAPGVPPDENGKQRFAVEGLKDQRILYAISHDSGETWSQPQPVPVRHVNDDNYRAGERPAWGPVLHYDKKSGKVFVFYSLSRECARPTTPKTWEPGGDVRVIVGEHLAGIDAFEPKWGRPRTVLSEAEDAVPKVVAARMLVLRDGTWLLPYWSEQPRGDRVAMYVNAQNLEKERKAAAAGSDHGAAARIAALIAGSGGIRDVDNTDAGEDGEEAEDGFDVSACHAPVTPKGQVAALFGNKTYAGVLLSTDRGASWQAHGRLSDPRTDLIEGVAVELSDRVLMLFRTKIGCVFASASTDNGRTWSPAAPLNVPNSNTKFDAIALSPYSDTILMALNNHRRGPFCEGCRTHLDVIASADGGVSWHHVAKIEDEIRTGVRIHYPTMLQLDEARVVVAYSRFYLGKCAAPSQEQLNKNYAKFKDACPGLTSRNQGVKLAMVDVGGLKELPQMQLPSDSSRPEPSPAILRKVVNNYLYSLLHRDPGATDEDRRVWLAKLRTARWRDVCTSLAVLYDFEYLGGVKYLRKNKEMAEYFHSKVTVMAGESIAAGIEKFKSSSGLTSLQRGGGSSGGDPLLVAGGGATKTNVASALRDQMWRLKKGHFAHGVHRVPGPGGGTVLLTGGGDRSSVTMNHKLNARIEKQRAREAAEASAAEAMRRAEVTAAAAESASDAADEGEESGGDEAETTTGGVGSGGSGGGEDVAEQR